jgi:HEAT repeats
MECARRGTPEVVAGCVALLRGEQADDELILALGCGNGGIVIHDGPKQRNQYWRRVWGARGLLYAWADGTVEDLGADDALIAALADEHWRVREMAAKVIARRRIGAALAPLAPLRNDPVPRVRAAAERATVMLTVAGA